MRLILAGDVKPPQCAIDAIMRLNPNEYVVASSVTGDSLKQWALKTDTPVKEFTLDLDKRGFSALEYLMFEILDYAASVIAVETHQFLVASLIKKAKAHRLIVLDYRKQ